MVIEVQNFLQRICEFVVFLKKRIVQLMKLCCVDQLWLMIIMAPSSTNKLFLFYHMM